VHFLSVASDARFCGSADLESLVPSLDKIDGILLPKAESAHDIKLVDQFLIEAGDTEGRVKIWPAIESASSLLNLKQICESSPKRLDALIVRAA
jgi:citrate lyase beta subunit